ncbi:MAG: PKD domain-containing protein [Fibrobacteria bacterium]|nr:PKD domain-containing protein [Fibrobacteria bacterium]
MKIRIKKSIIYPLIYLSYIITTVQGEILINEVRSADETCDYCSFVELRNAGSGSQNLKGWVIKPSPSTGNQDFGGVKWGGDALMNQGVTGFHHLPDITLESGEIVVFYFGCEGANSANEYYVPERDPITPFANVSLYSKPPVNPKYTTNGGVWPGSALTDFMRFGPGREPPREIIWDWDSRNVSSYSWWVKHADGIILDAYVKYNQWPDRHRYIDTKGLPKRASLSHNGTNTDSPKDWHFTPATPGQPNSTEEILPMPEAAPGPLENNSLPALPLTDTRPILFAASFDYQLQGDYPRDFYYHEMVSKVINNEYKAYAKITGTFSIRNEFGERGLWISPSSANVCNQNSGFAVFGDASWTDYRMTFTVKQTTGDHDRHQVSSFLTRLKDDTTRIEGYQFFLLGGTSISIKNGLGKGVDLGTVNMHENVDLHGGGDSPGVFKQLAKNDNSIVNPFWNKLNVTLEVKGDKITSTYDDTDGGVVTISANDNSYQSGKVGIGVVYGNYMYNDILVEDLRGVPEGGIPVAVIKQRKDTAQLNTPFQFTAEQSIYSGDQSKLTYVWDFGDGLRGSGQRPRHAFTGVGTYRVTCTISDGIHQTTDGLFLTVIGSNDKTPPSDVTNLKVANSDAGITLIWDQATDAESGISGYAIYREASPNPSSPPPTVHLVTVKNTMTFQDLSVKANIEYGYRVKALNGVNLPSSNYSNTVKASATTTSLSKDQIPKPQFNISQSSFNPVKKISFYSPVHQRVEVRIYSSRGHLIVNLFNGMVSSGKTQWEWIVPENKTGVFFVQVKTENSSFLGKIIHIQ